MVRTRSQTRIALTLLPPDVIAHILTMPGITVEDLAQVDRTCRLFVFAHGSPGKPCGHSIVESALRLRRFAQTGESVPATLPRPTWWTWPHLKAKLLPASGLRRRCATGQSALRVRVTQSQRQSRQRAWLA
jgi:hypothetical protein